MKSIKQLLFGKRYRFTHNEFEGSIVFRARSAGAALEKYKGFLVTKVYGPFAVMYDRAVINEIVSKSSMSIVKEEDNDN